MITHAPYLTDEMLTKLWWHAWYSIRSSFRRWYLLRMRVLGRGTYYPPQFPEMVLTMDGNIMIWYLVATLCSSKKCAHKCVNGTYLVLTDWMNGTYSGMHSWTSQDQTWYFLFGNVLTVVVSYTAGVQHSFLKALLICFGSARRSARLSRAQ